MSHHAFVERMGAGIARPVLSGRRKCAEPDACQCQRCMYEEDRPGVPNDACGVEFSSDEHICSSYISRR